MTIFSVIILQSAVTTRTLSAFPVSFSSVLVNSTAKYYPFIRVSAPGWCQLVSSAPTFFSSDAARWDGKRGPGEK